MADQINQTLTDVVFIVGFQSLNDYKIPFFLLLLIIYMFTCTENLLIIFLVYISPRLHCPMYILIGNLLFCELVYTTDLVPLILHHTLLGRGVITRLGCILQFSVSGCIIIVEMLLLTLMSYDRFLAICKPLRYSALIHNRLCLYLLNLIWFISLSYIIPVFYMIINIEFCGPATIDNFFCDSSPYVSYAASKQPSFVILSIVSCFTVLVLPFVLIVLSYAFIIFTILGIKTSEGRRKAFSTCSSHLLVVTISVSSMICLFVLPRSDQYLNVYKALSFTYFSVTPMVNPMIYTFRNEEIHKALQAALSKMKTVHW